MVQSVFISVLPGPFAMPVMGGGGSCKEVLLCTCLSFRILHISALTSRLFCVVLNTNVSMFQSSLKVLGRILSSVETARNLRLFIYEGLKNRGVILPNLLNPLSDTLDLPRRLVNLGVIRNYLQVFHQPSVVILLGLHSILKNSILRISNHVSDLIHHVFQNKIVAGSLVHRGLHQIRVEGFQVGH
nr:hypothetical protein Iba_chr07cCG13050 [Ipomoea batatas]